AVGGLSGVLEVSAPLVRVGGLVVAMRGPHGKEEAARCEAAAGKLGLRLARLVELELPGGWGKRTVVAYEKAERTDVRFPRRAGIPFKRPLCV
ncbi:MAG: 16S rRNA (guanine(527)-N(7))-methyltransferase RsmG, partial [Bacillota bacterium]